MDTFNIFRDSAGDWRWHRKAPNGEIVADSGEGYENRQDAIDAAHREAGSDAAVFELEAE